MNTDNIKIVTLDTSLTTESRKGSAMRQLYLQLSDVPNADWISLFEAERSFPRHSRWRRAWIERSYIVIDCVPDELAAYHLEDLKEDVRNANLKYQSALEAWKLKRKSAEDAAEVAAEVEREKLDELKGRLNFD